MAEARLGRSTLTPQYRWNPLANRYINPDGTFVTFEALRDALQRVGMAGTDNLLAHGDALARGRLSVSEWQRRMASDMKTQHLAMAAANRGGWAQLSQADKRWVQRETKKQLRFLERFAKQISTGEQALDGRFVTRIEMYGQASEQIGKAMAARVNKNSGMRFEKNVLGQAEHSPDCLAATARGWVDIGALSPPGQRDCMVRCQCHLIYRREAAEFGETETEAA